jgi:hypothetical protein
MTKAGFDLTDISAEDWQMIIDVHGLTLEENDKGWVWARTTETGRNILISANNPITGEYHGSNRENEPDYASYIGIEGSAEFVTEVYAFIKRYATYYKSSEFGERNYI